MTDTLDVAFVDEIFGEVLRPPESITVPEWAERYRVVVSGNRAGPWRNDNAPHLVEPMLDYTDPGVSRIVCMFSPQTGKTEVALNCQLFDLDRRPRDAMYILGDQDTAREFAETRLIPTIMACEPLAEKLRGDKDDVKLGSIHFRDATLFLTGANSASRLANKPIGSLVDDEIDKWAAELKGRGRVEGSALELARARLDSWGREAREFCISTPTEEGQGIHAEYLASDLAQRHYPCPHCGGWERPKMHGADGNPKTQGGLRWEGGSGRGMTDEDLVAHVEKVRTTAVYECSHCGHGITEREHREALQNGRWVRIGERMLRDGTITGERVKTSVRGYHANWFDVPNKGFGDIAAEFVSRRGRVDRGFVNRVLGEPWRSAGSSTEASVLRDMADEQVSKARADGSSYERGSVPIGDAWPGGGVRLLVWSFDIQKDHTVWQVAGYGPRQDSSDDCARYLIDWGTAELPAVPTGRLDTARRLQDVIMRELKPAVHPLQEIPEDVVKATMVALRRRQWTGIDTGYRTEEIYHACATLDGKAGRVLGIKGEDSMRSAVDFQAAVNVLAPDRRKAAKLARRSVNFLRVHTPLFKDEALSMLLRGRPEPDQIDEKTGEVLEEGQPAGGVYTVWPEGLSDVYLSQLAAEKREPVMRHGRRVGVRWVKKRENIDNHWWDDTVYELAVLRVATGATRYGVAGGAIE